MIRRRSVLLGMASVTALMGCETSGSMSGGGGASFGQRPLVVTGESEDPLYTNPYIEVEEWRDTPMAAPTQAMPA